MKLCRTCGESKHKKKFTKGKADCKKCRSASTCVRYKTLSGAEREAWISRSRERSLKSKYGINFDILAKMFINQDSRCAVCEKHSSEFKKGLHVDHNHTTGVVRELLCPNCNMALGSAMEDKSILLKLINYVEKHEGPSSVVLFKKVS